jgi:orotate phosphoribosyltransferase
MQDDFYRRGWEIIDMEPLEALRRLGGYYECPKQDSGKRLGPLVGYAGKYDAGDGKMLQYVGDVYANFSAAEARPRFYHAWADRMKFSFPEPRPDVVLGMPMGGIAVAFALADVMHGEVRFAFAEKKITAIATETLREQSQLVLARHELFPGERVVIAEDVTNNFSTTAEAVKLIYEAGALPVAIMSFLNRSTLTVFEGEGRTLPVISLISKPFPQYRQDDPAVADDIAKGNVVLKPKNEWPRLMKAMEENRLRLTW